MLKKHMYVSLSKLADSSETSLSSQLDYAILDNGLNARKSR